MKDCNYIYALSFEAGGDSGLALVSARNDRDAMQILRNGGRFNCTPEAYVLKEYKNIGLSSTFLTQIILETYTNAQGVYAALVKYVDALKGDTPDFSIGTVETLPAGSEAYVSLTGTLIKPILNFGIPKGDSGLTTIDWGNITGTISRQVDLMSELNSIRASAESKYAKPSSGIPISDLAQAVRNSLTLADTALQSFTETDPTVPSWAKQENKPTYNYSEILNPPTIPTALADLSDDSTHRLVTDTDKTTWSGKQAALESGVNIKTINGDSILGEGNLVIQGGGGGSTVSWGTPGADYVPLSVDGTSKNLLTSHQSLTGKADKVSSATSGHFAGLDGNGNLTDSGKSASDFVAGTEKLVKYSSQSLSSAEQAQARTNIGAGTYSKPSGGIPSSDLSSAVQTSLGKADTALQSETDPTVPSWAKQSTKPTYSYSEIQNTPTIPELTDYTDAELQTAIDTAFAGL